MRTTIDIPNALLKKAKIKAIEENITLKELFLRSLTQHLEGDEMNIIAPWKKLHGTVNADNLKPEDSAFDEHFEPESEFFFQVNESKKTNNDS